MTSQSPFELNASGSVPASGSGQKAGGKWGLAAAAPGANATLCLPAEELAPCTGTISKCRTASVIFLAHLRSWALMGQAVVNCSGACACDPVVLDAHRPPGGYGKVTITDMGAVYVSKAPRADPGSTCCQLTFTVLPTTESGYHHFKLQGVSLLGASSRGISGVYGWAFGKAVSR